MKKIMFNDKYGLTRAVIDGRKTQTRRIIPADVINYTDLHCFLDFNKKPLKEEDKDYICYENNEGLFMDIRLLARYKVGEEVAVAQSYKDAGIEPDGQVLVKWVRNPNGSYDDAYQKAKYLKGWSNKMFVKADLMPHRIKITNVRVERLQDISDEDCLKEGIDEDKLYSFGKLNEELSFDTPRKAYAALIDKVSGKGTWDSNPWVFVYDFELIR